MYILYIANSVSLSVYIRFIYIKSVNSIHMDACMVLLYSQMCIRS